MPLLTNKHISLKVRGRLYGGCVRSSMLHGNETWPVRKENELALQQAEIRMVRWMCGRMPWIVLMEEADKGRLMTMIDVSG